MAPSDKCIALVKASEGCRLTAYPDPATGGQPVTIGWGHAPGNIKLGTTWIQSQAEEALEADLMHASGQLDAMLGKHPVTQGQYDALVDFIFNLGAGALRSSTLLKKHSAGDYAGAKAEFGRWTRAAGKVMPGLVKRRAAEAALYGS